MGDQDGEPLSLQDEDRLPWLEAVDDVNDDDSVSPLKLAGFVLAGLILLGLVVGGVWWFQNRPGPEGNGTLIAAQEGDYKVKPDEPGGMKVEGEGDTALPTSDGAGPNGTVDLDAVPETPVAGSRARPASAAPPVVAATRGSATTAVPPSGGTLRAPAPSNVPAGVKAPGAASGGSLVQLGAFATPAEANGAWSSISKRFPWVAALGKQVVQAEVNGKTVQRLRITAGSHDQAVDICKRLKVAGQDCLIAAN